MARARWRSDAGSEHRRPTRGRPAFALAQPPARDLETAYEIFCKDVYAPALDRLRSPIDHVVDLGANTGYALVYLAGRLRDARFTVFEPNPRLVRALYRNVQLAGLESRVTMHAAAAATAFGSLDLTDQESESTVLARPGVKTVRVPAADLFEAVRGVPVQLLKMDIEGAEYALLSDERFRAWRPAAIVMEWHSTEQHPDGRGWCAARLEQLGYAVDPYMDIGPKSGMIFATLRA